MNYHDWIRIVLLALLLSGALAFAVLVPELAFAARDLTSAAQAAVSTATTVARAASLLGILCGALIFQIPGAVHFARATFISGVIGAVLSFGGTGLISLLQSIFGG